MQTVLALDLSTKPGVAVFENGRLKHYETLFAEVTTKDFGGYPYNYILLSESVAKKVMSVVDDLLETRADLDVVIEETTKGKNSYSQKLLEFIHFAVLKGLQVRGVIPAYVRTGVWRGIVGANQNQEEKILNSQIRKIKKTTGAKLAKIEGKVVGKRTKKHSALRAFKEHFGIELPRKMEDACDAALVGLAYIKGAPVCDGKTTGGIRSKK